MSPSSNPPNTTIDEPSAPSPIGAPRAGDSRGEAIETIEGEVVRITFANEETHFRVIRVRPFGRREAYFRFSDDNDTIKIVGKFPPVRVGNHVRVLGVFEDSKHGFQLSASTVSEVLPQSAAGIERYLASGVIKGIGAKTAKKLVATFGEKTIWVLDHEPDRLREVPNLTPRRKERLLEAWRQQRGAHELMVLLASFGVKLSLAEKISQKYGPQAIAMVTGNPYRLAIEISGIGFRTADQIARQVGISLDHPDRGQAAILHCVSEIADEGHTVTPEATLVDRTARLLNTESATDYRAPAEEKYLVMASQSIAPLLRSGFLSMEPEGIGSRHLLAKERSIALRLSQRMTTMSESLHGVRDAIEAFELATQVTLAPAQRAAIDAVSQHPAVVITGGPGVGKTTVVRAILALFRRAGLTTSLAAPTGRAAKRMQEATDQPATTLHRLLEVDPATNSFRHNREVPLELDALIVDETSMVDVPLFDALLDALPDRVRLVLVGDVDQLPSVGPGAILRDVIDSKTVFTVRLTEVFRQAGSSQIVRAAHAVLRGDVPESSSPNARAQTPRAPNGELFFVVREDPEEAAATIGDFVQKHIPRAFGLSAMTDIQVLVPMLKTSVGTRALNQMLQARLNPPSQDSHTPPHEIARGDVIYREGDRVMQMRNDYEREIFNGDIGRVTHLQKGAAGEPSIVTVDFDQRTVTCQGEQLDELVHAYACTVHKAQGSEYPAVVLGLLRTHYVMLARKLLYTAITRAKRLCVIVGSQRAVADAARDLQGEERRTTLSRKLAEHGASFDGDEIKIE